MGEEQQAQKGCETCAPELFGAGGVQAHGPFSRGGGGGQPAETASHAPAPGEGGGGGGGGSGGGGGHGAGEAIEL